MDDESEMVRNGLGIAGSYDMLWMCKPPNMVLNGFDPKIDGHGDIPSNLMPENKSSAAPKHGDFAGGPQFRP